MFQQEQAQAVNGNAVVSCDIALPCYVLLPACSWPLRCPVSSTASNPPVSQSNAAADRFAERKTAFDHELERQLARLQEAKFVTRLWQRDGALFSADPAVQRSVSDRLGWLFHLDQMRDQIDRMVALYKVVERQGYDRVGVLGMGGSSLWPEVVGKHLRGNRGLQLRVADSTHPQAVAELIEWGKAGKPLWLVATKSGGTIETLSLYHALHQLWPSGSDYIAITDPGSSLQGLAHAAGFREVFLNPADIGGRFSAVSLFGLVPAVLTGVVVHDAISRIGAELTACREEDPFENPGVHLGAQLAAAYNVGRWQLRIGLGKDIKGFSAWIEQLIGESTGKHGVGLLPVPGTLEETGEALQAKLAHAFVVGATTFAYPDEDFVARAQGTDAPGFFAVMPEPADLWNEVVRWCVATATAGFLLGINPFDEPDVSAAKAATAGILSGALQPRTDVERTDVEGVYQLVQHLTPALQALSADAYVAVLCYLAPNAANQQRLDGLRQSLQAVTDAAVTVQFGPRYLHSTGQYHKGGPDKGHFVLLHDFGRLDAGLVAEVAIPGQPFGFGQLVRAQAEGDVAVLHERGRPVQVVHLVAKSAK